MRGLPQKVRQRDERRNENAAREPARKENAPLRKHEQTKDDADGEEDDGVFTLHADTHDRADDQPPARVGSLDDAQHVERRQRPQPQSDDVGRQLRSEIHEDRRERRNQCREELRKRAAAEFGSQQAGGVDRCRGKYRANQTQEEERVAEELRARRQKRRDRRLVDVSPRRMKATDDKVQFVAEEAVMRIAGEMDCQGNERRRKGQARGGATDA